MRFVHAAFVAVGVLAVSVFLPAGAQEAPDGFVPVTEANGWYEVEIPAGWSFDDGAVAIYGSVLPAFSATSPDETQILFYGLYSPGAYVLPGRSRLAGETVEVNGYVLEVRAYEPIETFAPAYVLDNILILDCVDEPTAEVEPAELPADLSSDFNARYQAVNVTFRCEDRDVGPMVAEVQVRLGTIDLDANTSLWFIDMTAGYLSRADLQDDTLAALEHSMSTLAPGPLLQSIAQMQADLDAATEAFAYATEMSGLLAGLYGARP
jgi:hypothetical protein